jgi:hypothetical protein
VLESFAAPLALAALVVAVVALLLALSAAARARARRTTRPLPALVDADALEAFLRDQQARLDRMADAVDTLDGRAGSLEGDARRAVQHVGMVRFNPFEDTGSNQSFALAVLDGDANGVILSSLHSRQQTRLYVKEIVAGRSEAPLSAEESEALKKAGIGAS